MKKGLMPNLLLWTLLLACGWAGAQTVGTYEFTEISAIPYYQGAGYDSANHKLNLVVPKGIKNPPLLVWIGGGAWSLVNRDKEMDLARKFAQSGIAVASLGHRLSAATWKDPALNKGIKHPEHVRDVARAIKFLHVHASKYGYAAGQLFVGGYSSGGHLSALVAMDGQYLGGEGLTRSIIKGVIPIAGTYDVAHYHEALAAAYGRALADNHVGSVFGLTKGEFQKYSPTTYADSLSAPMLLISETNTSTYTRVFEDRLREREYKELEVLHINRLNHAELWKHLSFAPQSIYRELIEDFIRRHAEGIVP